MPKNNIIIMLYGLKTRGLYILYCMGVSTITFVVLLLQIYILFNLCIVHVRTSKVLFCIPVFFSVHTARVAPCI